MTQSEAHEPASVPLTLVIGAHTHLGDPQVGDVGLVSRTQLTHLGVGSDHPAGGLEPEPKG